MSDFTNIPEKLATALVTLVTDLLAANVTHGLQQPTDIPDGEFPHLMLHSWGVDNAIIDHQQMELTYTATVDLWFRDKTQTQVRPEMDAIINGWTTHRTLEGTVDNSFMTSIGILEHPEKPEKVVRMEFAGFKTENL